MQSVVASHSGRRHLLWRNDDVTIRLEAAIKSINPPARTLGGRPYLNVAVSRHTRTTFPPPLFRCVYVCVWLFPRARARARNHLNCRTRLNVVHILCVSLTLSLLALTLFSSHCTARRTLLFHAEFDSTGSECDARTLAHKSTP